MNKKKSTQIKDELTPVGEYQESNSNGFAQSKTVPHLSKT